MTKKGPEAVFREGLARNEIRIQECQSCGRSIFFPRVICPHCGDGNLVWRQVSGRGEVHTTTTVRRRAEHGGDYNVCMVDLIEGVRMMSRVEGIPPEAVRIGMAVDLFVGEIDNCPAVLCKPVRS